MRRLHYINQPLISGIIQIPPSEYSNSQLEKENVFMAFQCYGINWTGSQGTGCRNEGTRKCAGNWCSAYYCSEHIHLRDGKYICDDCHDKDLRFADWPPRCVNSSSMSSEAYYIDHGSNVRMKKGLEEHCTRCRGHLCFRCARSSRDKGFVDICANCVRQVSVSARESGNYEEWNKIRFSSR